MREDIEKQREALLQEAANRRKELQSEVTGLVDHVENKGKKIVLITGGILLGYLVLDLVIRHRGETKVVYKGHVPEGQEPVVVAKSEDSYLIRTLKQQMVNFILNVVTRSLNELIEQLMKKKAGLPND